MVVGHVFTSPRNTVARLISTIFISSELDPFYMYVYLTKRIYPTLSEFNVNPFLYLCRIDPLADFAIRFDQTHNRAEPNVTV